MSNNVVIASSATQGSLALTTSRPRFRVIEGGLSERRQQNSMQIPVRPAAKQPRPAQARPAAGTRRVARAQVRVQEAPRTDGLGIGSILCTVALSLAVAIVWFVPDALAAHRVNRALEGATYQTVTVHTGDTLWGIAEDHGVAGCTTAELVQQIRSINNLDDANLVAGMHISVPHVC